MEEKYIVDYTLSNGKARLFFRTGYSHDEVYDDFLAWVKRNKVSLKRGSVVKVHGWYTTNTYEV